MLFLVLKVDNFEMPGRTSLRKRPRLSLLSSLPARVAGHLESMLRPPATRWWSIVALPVRLPRDFDPEEPIDEGVTGVRRGFDSQRTARRGTPFAGWIRSPTVPARVHNEPDISIEKARHFLSIFRALIERAEIRNVQGEPGEILHAYRPQELGRSLYGQPVGMTDVHVNNGTSPDKNVR